MTATNTRRAAAEMVTGGTDTATGPAGGPRPGGAAGAVWDALTANPGATTMAIANAAGVTRAAAGKELTALTDAGHVVRAPGDPTGGGRAGGDTWTATGDATAPTAPTGGDVPAGSVTGDMAGTGDAAADADPADLPAAAPAEVPAPEVPDVTPGPDTASEEEAGEVAETAGGQADEAAPPAPVAAAPVVTGQTVRDAMRILEEEAGRREVAEAELRRAEAEEEARRAKAVADLTKARTTEDTRHALADLLAAVTTAYAAVITGDGDAVAAGLEAIFTETATVRRVSKAAPARTATATGTTVTAATAGNGSVRTGRNAPRPLRPAVAAHLAAHPGLEFTPGEIAKVLDRSSGAVANALDTMVGQGEAELTCEHPNRYRAAAAPTAPHADTSTEAAPAGAATAAGDTHEAA